MNRQVDDVPKSYSIQMYLGNPLVISEKTLEINGRKVIETVSSIEILRQCADHAKISVNAAKSFLLVQGSKYYIPTMEAFCHDKSDMPIYYRYVDYHTDRDCFYYNDPECFAYVYHQYLYDVRNEPNMFTEKFDDALKIDLSALEILKFSMSFGKYEKPHKMIQFYSMFTDALIDISLKLNKNLIKKSLRDNQEMRTEFECMEKYLSLVDNVKKKTKYEYNVFLDHNTDKRATLRISKEKVEVLEITSSMKSHPNSVPKKVVYADSKLSCIEAMMNYRIGDGDYQKIRIITPTEKLEIFFNNNQKTEWTNSVALLYLYTHLEYPRARKDPVSFSITNAKGVNIVSKETTLLPPAPCIHYKTTRQDARMILKRYGTQDGWYMYTTFEAKPNNEESISHGTYCFSYCMDGEIIQFTVDFYHVENLIFRMADFPTKKFCSLFELASHISIRNRHLHTFISEKMAEDVSEPENSYVIPIKCIEKISEESHQYRMYDVHSRKKVNVRVIDMPNDFKIDLSKRSEFEKILRKLCDPESIHDNILRSFGISKPELHEIDRPSKHLVIKNRLDEYVNKIKHIPIKHITEDFGINLFKYLNDHQGIGDKDLLSIAFQIASGINHLHCERIVHGFPVLHNCYIDCSTNKVKIGGIGVLRISVMKTDDVRDGLTGSLFEQLVHEASPLYHPARWLPKETLFNYNFSTQTDRWSFGCVLWQLFHNLQLPLKGISDEQIVEQLQQDRESWFKQDVMIDHPNNKLKAMLQETVNYCLSMSEDDFGKVVHLLDPTDRDTEQQDGNYTFANFNPDSTDDTNINVEIIKVTGELKFRSHCKDKFDRGYSRTEGYNIPGGISDSEKEDSSDLTEEEEDEEGYSYETTGGQFFEEHVKTIEASEIIKGERIGNGNFATVHKGIWRCPNKPDREVAIKIYNRDHMTVKRANVRDIDRDIKKEIQAMGKLQHQYIMPLRGICKEENTTFVSMLIMPYYEFGSLEKYIEQNRFLENEILCGFAQQIAEGMEYLKSMTYIHCDLATRNVLVQDHSKVRIADLGLSRDVAKEYYQHTKGRQIPFLWYPPEFFDTYKFGYSSDVWSYGVTCYEIFNNAETPYSCCEPPIKEISHLRTFLNSGKRLELSQDIPDIFRTVIKNCWRVKSERWKIEDILSYIRDNIEQFKYEPFQEKERKKKKMSKYKEVGVEEVEVEEVRDEEEMEEAMDLELEEGQEEEEVEARDVEEEEVRESIQVVVPEHFVMDEGQMYAEDFTFSSGDPLVGSVVEGQYTKLNRLNQSVRVRSYSLQSNFFEEVTILRSLVHPSIEKMLGYVVEIDRLLLVTDYYAFGNLYTYCKHNNITERTKLLFSKQVCDGLKYIIDSGCIHQMVVLTNVLVKTATICVIGSYGISRANTSTNNDIPQLPILLTYSPELLNSLLLHTPLTFTAQSCVWSFGMLLWQLFSTDAGDEVLPYHQLQTEQDHAFLTAVLEFLQQHRLSVDPQWPAANVINQCWGAHRASFGELSLLMNEIQ